MASINELRQKRANLWEKAKEILERSEEEDRAMHADEREQWEKLNDEMDELEERIKDKEKARDRDRSVDEPQTTPRRPEPGGDTPDSGPDEERKMEIVEKYWRYGRGALTHEDHRDIRALQADDDGAGGFTVAPETFVEELIQSLDDEVFIRDMARTFTIESSDSLGAPELESDPEDATWQSEINTVNEDTQMDFAKRELHPHASAKRILVSNKMLNTSSFDIPGLIRDRLRHKFGVTEEKAFLTGSGNLRPLGVFTASNQGISTSRDVSSGNEATEITADGLINAKYNLKAQYQNSARWIFHRDAVKQIRKLKDGDGQYLWRAGITADRPDTILEQPFFMSEFAPNTFTSGNYVGIIGDFSFYWIVTALMMTVQRLDELYAEDRQTGFIGDMEVDGMPVLEEAFARVQLA